MATMQRAATDISQALTPRWISLGVGSGVSSVDSVEDMANLTLATIPRVNARSQFHTA